MLLPLSAALLFCALPATPQIKSQSQPIPRSCAGATILHPEELSGIWETHDRQEGTFSIHLMLSTEVSSSATTLVGLDQKCQTLEWILYRRPPDAKQTQQHRFSDAASSGDLQYIHGRLILHAADVDLDLHRAPDDAWAGRFHFLNFNSQVTLRRPALPSAPSPLVGTWLDQSDGLSTTCLHIVEPSPNYFEAWSDQIALLGDARYAAGVKQPPAVTQYYGQPATILVSGNKASVQLGPDAGICCPHSFEAVPNDSGTAFQANWPTGPKQAAHQTAWKKLPGPSCLPD